MNFLLADSDGGFVLRRAGVGVGGVCDKRGNCVPALHASWPALPQNWYHLWFWTQCHGELLWPVYVHIFKHWQEQQDILEKKKFSLIIKPNLYISLSCNYNINIQT